MTNASNRSVKPDPGRAQDTLTSRTPQSGQSMRACRKASCWKKLIDFKVGGRFACPECGKADCPVHDTVKARVVLTDKAGSSGDRHILPRFSPIP